MWIFCFLGVGFWLGGFLGLFFVGFFCHLILPLLICILLCCTEPLNSIKLRNKLNTNPKSFKSIEKCKVLSYKPADRKKARQLKESHNTSIPNPTKHQIIKRGYHIPIEEHAVKKPQFRYN